MNTTTTTPLDDDYEQAVSTAFKQAATSITHLYKKSKSSYLQGYTQCLREIAAHCSSNAVQASDGRHMMPLDSLFEFINTKFAKVVATQSSSSSTQHHHHHHQQQQQSQQEQVQHQDQSFADIASEFIFDFRSPSTQNAHISSTFNLFNTGGTDGCVTNEDDDSAKRKPMSSSSVGNGFLTKYISNNNNNNNNNSNSMAMDGYDDNSTAFIDNSSSCKRLRYSSNNHNNKS